MDEVIEKLFEAAEASDIDPKYQGYAVSLLISELINA